MSKMNSKRVLKWAIAAAAVAAVLLIGFRFWKSRKDALPKGIASGNGRIEATLVDVAAREPLRVKKIMVDEGDLVSPGQVLVQMDTVTLEAQLAEAKANIAAAEERLAISTASIVKRKSEIDLATVELDRSERLVKEAAGSRRELDVRRARLEAAKASLAEAEAVQKTSKERIEVAKANAATVQTRINDATLRSPVRGRVLYRLAETGEVLASGGKALTLVDLEDVYMEIFLPSEQAANLKIGAEGRITVDYDPTHAVAARVSFVSPEAQFTPKQVETRSEREKLMFRVKLQVPRELSSRYTERIKTGVRGVGYVQVDPNTPWPARLQNLLGPPAQARTPEGRGRPAPAEQ